MKTKKTAKKLLSLFFAVVMLLSLIPLSALGGSNEWDSENTPGYSVRGGGTTYYRDGQVVSSLDSENLQAGELILSKTARQIGSTNEFEVTLAVKAGPGISSYEPYNIVFVLDATGSMMNPSSDGAQTTRFDEVKAATESAINDIYAFALETGKDVNIALCQFSSGGTIILDSTNVRTNFREILTALEDGYVEPQSSYYTNIYAGLNAAARTLVDDGTNCVLLLSDGIPNAPSGPDLTPEQAAINAANAIKEAGAELYSVYYSDSMLGTETMEQLASTGEHFYYADTGEAVKSIMNQITSNFEQTINGNLVTDPMGEYVTFIANSFSGNVSDDHSFDDSSNTITWSPSELTTGATLSYRVIYDPEFLDDDFNPLNGKTTFDYSYLGYGYTANFKVPEVRLEYVLETVDYTVKYFKNGVEVTEDEIYVTDTIYYPQPFEIELLYFDQSDDRYEGYKYDKTDPDGYEVGQMIPSGTVINVYYVSDEPEVPAVTYVSKTVKKIWADENNADGLRPGSISVQLYANGAAAGNAVVINRGNKWTYTWKNLREKDENQVAIKYTVKEVSVPNGYTAKYSADTFIITNTHTPVPTEPGLVLNVNKILRDPDGTLIGDGKEFTFQIIDSNKNLVQEVVVKANQDAVVVKGLKPGEVYTLAELSSTSFDFKGFNIFGEGLIEKTFLTFRVTLSSDNVVGVVNITLNNEMPLINIDEDTPPLTIPDWPDNPEIIEIVPDEIPLSVPQTGEGNGALFFGVIMALSAGALILISRRRKANK